MRVKITTEEASRALEQLLEKYAMSAAAPGSAMAQQMSSMIGQSQNHNALLAQLAHTPPPNNAAPWQASVQAQFHRDLRREQDRAHFAAADAALPDSDEQRFRRVAKWRRTSRRPMTRRLGYG